MQETKSIESHYFWQGKLVRLRPYQNSDWETLYVEDMDSEGNSGL